MVDGVVLAGCAIALTLGEFVLGFLAIRAEREIVPGACDLWISTAEPTFVFIWPPYLKGGEHGLDPPFVHKEF